MVIIITMMIIITTMMIIIIIIITMILCMTIKELGGRIASDMDEELGQLGARCDHHQLNLKSAKDEEIDE